MIRVKPDHKLLKASNNLPKNLPTTVGKTLVPKNDISFKTMSKIPLKLSRSKRKHDGLTADHKISEKYRKTNLGSQPYTANGVRRSFPFKNWYV